MKKFYLLGTFLLISACVSEQEQREASYRFEEVMRNQCEHTLGFASGTEGYMNCRMFYDEVLEYAGLTGTKSYSRVNQIQQRIETTNAECRRYWGQEGMTQAALWSCVQKKENAFIDEAIHQKELQEKEDVLTRSIANGQKDADAERRLQDRIDAERERVAKKKKKSPSKVKCKTYEKSNGYIQVKCK